MAFALAPMSDPKIPEDELAGTEQPFVTHLIELRDRLLRALAAVGAAALVLALYPGPGPLYDILAAPLVAHLPKGATLIATSVISPFMVPLKILLMSAFLLALPVVLLEEVVHQHQRSKGPDCWFLVPPVFYRKSPTQTCPSRLALAVEWGLFQRTPIACPAQTHSLNKSKACLEQ